MIHPTVLLIISNWSLKYLLSASVIEPIGLREGNFQLVDITICTFLRTSFINGSRDSSIIALSSKAAAIGIVCSSTIESIGERSLLIAGSGHATPDRKHTHKPLLLMINGEVICGISVSVFFLWELRSRENVEPMTPCCVISIIIV